MSAYVRSFIAYGARLLLPSWRFFDNPSLPPILYVRGGPSADLEHIAWEPALETIERRPYHLIFNPYGNAALALQSIVERAALRISSLSPDDHSDFLASTDFRLLRNITHARLSVDAPYFQFKVCIENNDPILVSEVYSRDE